MKLAVCVKRVPDTETRVRIADGGRGIVENDVNWVVSPYDEFAIEEALRIEQLGGLVIERQRPRDQQIAGPGEEVVQRLGPLLEGRQRLG